MYKLPYSLDIKRNETIYNLRGFSIIMVLFLHYNLTYPFCDKIFFYKIFGSNITYALFSSGNFGVTVFFVVSGFLITSNIIKRSDSLKNFYIRRFSRLTPCLLLALLFIFLFSLLKFNSFNSDGVNDRFNLFIGLISVIFCFHNILMQSLGYFNYVLNVYWSLSVEEVFYLFIPIILIYLKRSFYIITLCILFIVLAPFYRSYHSDNDIFYLYSNFSCFDSLSIGVLTSLIAQKWQPSGYIKIFMKALGWILLLFFWYNGFEGQNVKFSFTFISLSASLIIMSSTNNKNNYKYNIINWFGRYSYEIYLFHIIVLGIMRDLIENYKLNSIFQIPWFLIFVMFSCLVSYCVANFYGNPLNKYLREKFILKKQSLIRN